MDILLTNDDGIGAIGLRSLYTAFCQAGHNVHVVAPLSQQSAVGHAVTLFMPVKVHDVRESGFYGTGVGGTPVDCVKLGLNRLLGDIRPDLVVSGINAGANVGVDIIYSGTVSAATEAALVGISALAVSLDDLQPVDVSDQARWTADFIADMDWSALPAQCVLNLNFPSCDLSAAGPVCVCPQTRTPYQDWYDKRTDLHGQDYYWLGGEIPKEDVSAGTDRDLLWKQHITLTPLKFSFTDFETMNSLQKMNLGADT